MTSPMVRQEGTHLFLNGCGPGGIPCGCCGEAAWTLFSAAPEPSQPGHLPTLAPPMVPLELGRYVSSQPQWFFSGRPDPFPGSKRKSFLMWVEKK